MKILSKQCGKISGKQSETYIFSIPPQEELKLLKLHNNCKLPILSRGPLNDSFSLTGDVSILSQLPTSSSFTVLIIFSQEEEHFELLEYEWPDLPPIPSMKDAVSRRRVSKGISYLLPVDKGRNSINNRFRTDLRAMFQVRDLFVVFVLMQQICKEMVSDFSCAKKGIGTDETMRLHAYLSTIV